MASSIALLLLLLAAAASTIAELDEREPHIDPASTIAELLKAALTSTTAELDHVEPADCGGYRTYIVMLEPPEGGQDAHVDAARAWHRSFLPSATTAQGKPRLIHSYRTVFTGFAAWLTEEELKEVSAKPGFVRSFNNNIYRSQITPTPTPTSASFVDLSNHIGESPDNWPGVGGSICRSTRDDSGGRILDEQRDTDPAALYATGAGHVDLARAMDPGLAYDIDKAQYIGYLCSNFGEMAMRAVTRNSSGLCSDHEGVPQEQLNYPSIVVTLVQQQQLVVRTLTNLQADGLPEVYKVAVAMPGLVLVDVEPAELTFTSLGQKQSYSIRVAPMPKVTFIKGAVFDGSITWSSSRHVVRSPVVAVVGL